MTNSEIIDYAQEIIELMKDEKIILALCKLRTLEIDDRSLVIFMILFAISIELHNHPLFRF